MFLFWRTGELWREKIDTGKFLTTLPKSIDFYNRTSRIFSEVRQTQTEKKFFFKYLTNNTSSLATTLKCNWSDGMTKHLKPSKHTNAFKNTNLLKGKVISPQFLKREITVNLSFLVYLYLFGKQNLRTKGCNRLFRNKSHQMLDIRMGTKPPFYRHIR